LGKTHYQSHLILKEKTSLMWGKTTRQNHLQKRRRDQART
jgi:hypothetical protein